MTPRTIRLKLDYNLDPSDSETLIEAVKSNAFNIEFGIFQESVPYDLSGLTSVSMVIRPARGTATNLAAITLPVASLTALPNSVRWNRGTMQHGIFEWTTAQMNQTVTGDYDDYWWSCYALLTTNEEVTLGNGVFRIYDSNIANGGVPPVNPGATITADEADARYVRYDAATSLTGGQQTQARENIDADNAANLTSGIIPDARMPNLTGDVTTVEGAVATTIGAGKVTNAMLAGSIDLATKVTGILPDTSMPNLTGDITTSEGAVATTLATVNSNVGSFGSATQASAITVNAKGLVTAASAITITPAESSITFTDITTNNATASKHGFLPKLSGSASDVLKGDGSWGAESAGAGTVTSVAMTTPSILSVAGSPVTTSGTLAVTLATQAANVVFAGPTSGGAATPTFRSIVDADLPTGIAVNKLAALTASRLVVSDASGFISASSVTSTEAGYLSGVTSALQTQLGNKQPLATILTSLSALADAAGVLTNNGSGTLSYTALGTGESYAELGYLVRYDSSSGEVKAPVNFRVITPSSTYPYTTYGNGAISHITAFLTGTTIQFAAPSGNKVFTIPATTGTAITTGDSGTVTNTMLSGSIDLTTKVTGTLPAANGGTGLSSLGTGVATALGINVGSAGAFVALNGALGTPSSGTLTSCTGLPAAGVVGTAAILGANTFTAAQFIDGSADVVQLTVQGHSTQTSNLVLLEKSDGTDVLTIDVSGNITGNGADYSGMTISTGGTHRSLTLSAPGGSGTILMNPGADVQSFSPVRVRNISGVGVPLNGVFRFASTNNDDDGSVGVAIKAKEAATLQLGVDAAGVTNQTLTAASRITSDGVGANLTISAGNGRGGAGGSLIFSTYTTAAAATIGTLTTRLTINTLGEIIPVLPTSSAGLTTGALWNDTGTVKVA